MNLKKHLVGVVSASVMFLGCGGKVVFIGDDGGQGGAGSNGNTSAATGSTVSSASTASATSAVSSSSGFMSPCDRLCMDHAACFGGDDCMSECLALFVADCSNQASEYVLCVAHNFGPMCEIGSTCDGELAVYENCAAPTIDCLEDACEVLPRGNCNCTALCAGVPLLQRCHVKDDFYECECEADGQDIGGCTQGEPVCDLDGGCCKAVWLLGNG